MNYQPVKEPQPGNILFIEASVKIPANPNFITMMPVIIQDVEHGLITVQPLGCVVAFRVTKVYQQTP